MSGLYWLTDEQMARQSYFPKSHGKPRTNGRQVLGGIVFGNLAERRWHEAPNGHRPAKTLYNRPARWGRMASFCA